MKKVILDTNFLLAPGRFKIDIFSEIKKVMDEPYELYIMEKTIEELEKIKRTGSGKDKTASKIALSLVNTKALKKIPCSDYVDDAILDFADKDTLVATQDVDLKKRLKQKGISVIVMIQKKTLKIER